MSKGVLATTNSWGEWQCSKCSEWLSESEFHRDSSRWNGIKHICKTCKSKQDRDRIFRSPRFKFKGVTPNRVEVTAEQYNSRLEEQDGGCAICGKSEQNNGKRLAFDHCHSTGKVRGLLCAYCNLGLGLFDDNLESLKAAIEYLQISK